MEDQQVENDNSSSVNELIYEISDWSSTVAENHSEEETERWTQASFGQSNDYHENETRVGVISTHKDYNGELLLLIEIKNEAGYEGRDWLPHRFIRNRFPLAIKQYLRNLYNNQYEEYLMVVSRSPEITDVLIEDMDITI